MDELWRRAGTTGLVLGKFLPPHLGHLHLIRTARAQVDKLWVVVGSLRREPIAADLRVGWMRQLCPDCEVLDLRDENPQDPSEHPEFWAIWQRSLLSILPAAPDVVFSSEAYGEPLARQLGARHVPVDPLRLGVHVRATDVRAAPWANFHQLPDIVRAHYVRTVVAFGPESCGKTTLCQDIARQLHTCWVPEYARTWLLANPGMPDEAGFASIARGQLATQMALRCRARGLLVCDTDLALSCVWAQFLLGAVPKWLHELATQSLGDYYLLCAPDLPWCADSVRYLPGSGQAFFAACVQVLTALDRPFVVVRGSRDERCATAMAALKAAELLPDARCRMG